LFFDAFLILSTITAPTKKIQSRINPELPNAIVTARSSTSAEVIPPRVNAFLEIAKMIITGVMIMGIIKKKNQRL